jgi:hypothetical protein
MFSLNSYSLHPTLIAILAKSSKTKAIVILLCYLRTGSVPSLLYHTGLQHAQPHMRVPPLIERIHLHLFWDEIQTVERQLKRDGGSAM